MSGGRRQSSRLQLHSKLHPQAAKTGLRLTDAQERRRVHVLRRRQVELQRERARIGGSGEIGYRNCRHT